MKQTILIGATVAVVFATIFVYVPRENPSPQTVSVLSTVSTTTSSSTRTRDAREPATVIAGTSSHSPATTTAVSATRATLKSGDKTYSVPVSPNETVIDAMHALASTSDFTFTGRDYPGLGEFIDSINGVKNAGGMYWMLYINGVSAALGASAITVNAGDVVEWKYEKSY